MKKWLLVLGALVIIGLYIYANPNTFKSIINLFKCESQWVYGSGIFYLRYANKQNYSCDTVTTDLPNGKKNYTLACSSIVDTSGLMYEACLKVTWFRTALVTEILCDYCKPYLDNMKMECYLGDFYEFDKSLLSYSFSGKFTETNESCEVRCRELYKTSTFELRGENDCYCDLNDCKFFSR